ncbi:neural cell adhesion molecule 1-like isoform X2 [Hyalella azteca]|uniref:Neural cell adhesion molecule 1-like isoform X2 n=1 Tax=Hyalella azteca TaxID=294128 RepID=A0A8B7P857_HYAAZ|nr:neural cell adhesion molecule 1-like isoform X2 [Hyalella azteca]
MRISGCILTFLLITAAAAQKDDEYEDYAADLSDTEPPQFLSVPEEFSVEVGGEITFPCHVQHLGKRQMVFQFNSFTAPSKEKLYFAGTSRISANRRLRKDEHSFTLTNIKRSDAGQYACKLYDPPLQVVHVLRVQYPAMIRRISPDKQHAVKGESVTLQCEAEGNPEPAIHWSRRGGRLPSGSHSEEGLSITLEKIDRREAGTYVCTASNGIGEPSSAEMRIEVEYRPEITTEESILHTGNGDEAKLVCIVHGHPAPTVHWRRGDHLVASDKHLMTHDGEHRHSLIIRDVQDDDFGDYTCSAKNRQGVTEQTVVLTGLPKVPKMTSSPAGGEKETYTLTWETESFSPIVQYRVQFRKVGRGESRNKSAWKDSLYTAKPQRPRHNQPRSSNRVQVMGHAIPNLDPATDYQATVAVENKFGWSPPSPVFQFHTRKEVADGQSASTASTMQSLRTVCVTVLSAVIISAFV